MQPNDATLVVKGSGGTLSKETFWRKLGDPKYEEKHDQPEETQGDETFENKDSKKRKSKRPKLEDTLFRFPVATCSKEFLSEKNLEKHMDVGKHDSEPEKMNLQDITLNLLSSYLEKAVTPKVCGVIDEAMMSLTDDPSNSENGRLLPMGWALPKRRPSTPFPATVKAFLKEIYDEGERTNRVEPNGSRVKRSDDPELDEVNALFDTEGDPELEWETEPLFDEADVYRIAIRNAHNELF
ncbi:hypothetical protein PENTCL1PPCAC_20289, partial [Pristionchus entomophagus]